MPPAGAVRPDRALRWCAVAVRVRVWSARFEGMDGMFAAGSLSAPRARIALQQALHAVGRAGDSPAVRVWQDVFVKTAP